MVAFIRSNKISVSIMLVLAVLAAACTLLFAITGGIINKGVIVTRMGISFSLFLLVGLLPGIFLQNTLTDYLYKTRWTAGEKAAIEGDAEQDPEPEPEQNLDEEEFSPAPDSATDDSFERIVVVDKDEDNQ